MHLNADHLNVLLTEYYHNVYNREWHVIFCCCQTHVYVQLSRVRVLRPTRART